MTWFLDVRLHPVGGTLATQVAISAGTDIGDYAGADINEFLAATAGRHVLFAAHGFNVNRADGINALSHWEAQLQLADPAVFVGILWPGDSSWAHGLDYPEEPRIANDAGKLLAPFIDTTMAAAASLSFASHSLGARVVLETVQQLARPVRRVTLMAPAIDDNCLNTEFKDAAAKAGEISVLASRKDEVLSAIFPLGNLLAGILTVGHPWWHGALGHTGPVNPTPITFQAPFELPDAWKFGHGDYLKVAAPAAPALSLPQDVPPPDTGGPDPAPDGWQSAWTAAFASTRFE